MPEAPRRFHARTKPRFSEPSQLARHAKSHRLRERVLKWSIERQIPAKRSATRTHLFSQRSAPERLVVSLASIGALIEPALRVCSTRSARRYAESSRPP